MAAKFLRENTDMRLDIPGLVPDGNTDYPGDGNGTELEKCL